MFHDTAIKSGRLVAILRFEFGFAERKIAAQLGILLRKTLAEWFIAKAILE